MNNDYSYSAVMSRYLCEYCLIAKTTHYAICPFWKDRLPVTWIVHFKPHVSKYACSNSSDFYPTLCSDFAVGGKQVGSIKSQMMRYKSSCLKTNPQGD